MPYPQFDEKKQEIERKIGRNDWLKRVLSALTEVVREPYGDKWKKILQTDEDKQQCIQNALEAIAVLAEIQWSTYAMIRHDESNNIQDIVLECFNDSLKFVKKGNINVATEGFSYIKAVFEALKKYENEKKEHIANHAASSFHPSPAEKHTTAFPLETLKGSLEEAQKNIKGSEINTQRGFKRLFSWFKNYINYFSYTNTFLHAKSLADTFISKLESHGSSISMDIVKKRIEDVEMQYIRAQEQKANNLRFTKPMQNSKKTLSKLLNFVKVIAEKASDNFVTEHQSTSAAPKRSELIDGYMDKIASFFGEDFLALWKILLNNQSNALGVALKKFIEVYIRCVKEVMNEAKLVLTPSTNPVKITLTCPDGLIEKLKEAETSLKNAIAQRIPEANSLHSSAQTSTEKCASLVGFFKTEHSDSRISISFSAQKTLLQ